MAFGFEHLDGHRMYIEQSIKEDLHMNRWSIVSNHALLENLNQHKELFRPFCDQKT
jgi:hypothetical protein